MSRRIVTPRRHRPSETQMETLVTVIVEFYWTPDSSFSCLLSFSFSSLSIKGWERVISLRGEGKDFGLDLRRGPRKRQV